MLIGNTLRYLFYLATIALPVLGANPEKDLASALKVRYKGAQLVVMANGFYGGEFRKAVQARQDFVNWWHYDQSVPIRDKKSVLDTIDDRTFASAPTFTRDGLGTNVFPIEKGESLLVSNVLFGCGHGQCTLHLFLDTSKLSKTTALDPRKETQDVNPLLLESAGLGCVFHFVLPPGIVDRPKAVEEVVETVRKYLQPTNEAKQSLDAEKSIEIDVGATEEEVIAKLGAPIKSIRIGPQKTLKYADMTIVLKDGKVVDVKVE